jgi:hypothetical protein
MLPIFSSLVHTIVYAMVRCKLAVDGVDETNESGRWQRSFCGGTCHREESSDLVASQKSMVFRYKQENGHLESYKNIHG